MLWSMTPALAVQPTDPDSKPGLVKSCVVVAQLPLAPVTVTERLVVCDPDAAVPVTVSVNVCGAAAEVAERVRLALCPEETHVGVSVAVTPLGVAEVASEIVCALPDVVEVAMVIEPELLPACTVTLAGLAESEKSF